MPISSLLNALNDCLLKLLVITYLAGPVSVIIKAGGIVWSKPIALGVL